MPVWLGAKERVRLRRFASLWRNELGGDENRHQQRRLRIGLGRGNPQPPFFYGAEES
jgi:hypothetical protein